MGRIPLESPRIVPECDEMFFRYNLAQTTLRPLLRHPRGNIGGRVPLAQVDGPRKGQQGATMCLRGASRTGYIP